MDGLAAGCLSSMPLLNPGNSFDGHYSGKKVEILGSFSSGGQAELFAARWEGRTDWLVKWYKPHYRRADPDLRQRLPELIQRGAPSHYFCWPEEIVERGDEFGYVMPRAASQYQPLSFMLSGESAHSFRSAITAGLLLVHNLRLLHTEGLCYRDISDGNVLYEAASGDIRIIDNDNVSVDTTPGVMCGTGPYMPPEVVLGETGSSSLSDRHALAVLLFRLLALRHPLLGKFQDEPMFVGMQEHERERILFGKLALFTFDPNDTRNAPDPEQDGAGIVLWNALPGFIRYRFTRALTEGLRNPSGRVLGTEWKQDLARLADLLFHCPSCEAELFYDEERLRTEGKLAACWYCGALPSKPPVLRINGCLTVLGDEAHLYPHRIQGVAIKTALPQPAGEVRKGRLQNRTTEVWSAALRSGSSVTLGPGESCPVSELARIDFGKAAADVEH
jgi:eukaryotic-like serine/threonine-protein kinase